MIVPLVTGLPPTVTLPCTLPRPRLPQPDSSNETIVKAGKTKDRRVGQANRMMVGQRSLVSTLPPINLNRKAGRFVTAHRDISRASPTLPKKRDLVRINRLAPFAACQPLK